MADCIIIAISTVLKQKIFAYFVYFGLISLEQIFIEEANRSKIELVVIPDEVNGSTVELVLLLLQ